jgi:hypothetical protein
VSLYLPQLRLAQLREPCKVLGGTDLEPLGDQTPACWIPMTTTSVPSRRVSL